MALAEKLRRDLDSLQEFMKLIFKDLLELSECLQKQVEMLIEKEKEKS